MSIRPWPPKQGEKSALQTFFVDDEGMHLLDQRELPLKEVWHLFKGDDDGVEGVARAIETLAVRGAPAIGGAAALILGLWVQKQRDTSTVHERLLRHIQRLRITRPTAVNLFVALDAVSAVKLGFPHDFMALPMTQGVLSGGSSVRRPA